MGLEEGTGRRDREKWRERERGDRATLGPDPGPGTGVLSQ